MAKGVIASAVAIVIIVAMLVAIVITLGQTQTKLVCVESVELRERMRAMALAGMDAGFTAQASKLYEIWLRDPHDQPQRAIIGMQAALGAYTRARAYAVVWDPPLC